jgi:hypothetical protein
MHPYFPSLNAGKTALRRTCFFVTCRSLSRSQERGATAFRRGWYQAIRRDDLLDREETCQRAKRRIPDPPDGAYRHDPRTVYCW